MDLTEFRANHPGLYEQAIAEGATQEAKMALVHLELALAAGAPAKALRAIQNGWTAEEALPALRECASKTDATAAAFLHKVQALGLDGGARPHGGSLTSDARRLAASMGRSASVGSMDAADIVATIVTGRRPDGSEADAPEPIVIAPENDLRNYTHEEASRRVAEIVTGKKVAP